MVRAILRLFGALALAACATTPDVPVVRETAAVSASGDAADDPAIWIAPSAAESLVIATQKQGGLYVFNLSGAIVQEALGGRPNNVDLRPAFGWPNGEGTLVGASDRTDNSIVLWRFDDGARRLDTPPRARIATGFREIYGFCLGRMGDDFVAIATDKDSGEVGVWRISIGVDGAPVGERIARYTLGSIAEGCVVDDEMGAYYVAQERVGIWRIDLADAPGARRRRIDRVGAGGNLIGDVEGLAIWRGVGGEGYLIASVQGRSTFAVYERAGGNTYRGAFRLAASEDGAADGVEGTDGIDVASATLDPDFPQGLLVVQDDENTNPAQHQNFKYVSWVDVAAALSLR